jgi:protocatechuate 3,4-dioxygenase beta subunit
MTLRAVFRTDAGGRFSFRSIMPCAYPVAALVPLALASAVEQMNRLRREASRSER